MEPNLSADKKYWFVQSTATIVISDRDTAFHSIIRGKWNEEPGGAGTF
jgi:hypothetical protein